VIPSGAVDVGTDTLWVNRYRIGSWSNRLGRPVASREEAIELYRTVIWGLPHMRAYARERLRGRDLVCDCPLDQPCHADALLEIANGDG
jgi:hypothetical protein